MWENSFHNITDLKAAVVKSLWAESLLPFEIKGCAINLLYLQLLGHEKTPSSVEAVNEQLPDSLV